MKQYEDAHQVCPDDGTQLRVFNDSATRVTGKILDGRWLVQKKVAEGGMGEVYVGQQVSMNRQVALKILRPAMAASEEYVNRFFREANLASTIKHPNFVHIYDFGQEQELNVLYLAMEYLEGIDLADRVLQGRMAIDHVLEIGVQVCSALSAAHDANIIHRDLKPENIFLVDSGGEIHVKVLDFGIAKELGATTSVTRTGQIFGTPEYMSPEQCQNFANVDGRCDLYSLGCVLYELLTGRSPFHRDTVIATLLAQVQDVAPNLVDLGFDIPRETAEIVHRLMEKSPERRFASAREAREALEAELRRVRGNPEQMQAFWDSHRNTEEFDRKIDSGATTISKRRTSQYIDLDDLEHEVEIIPAPKRRVWPWVVALLLAAVGGVAAAAAIKAPEPVKAVAIDPKPAFLAAYEVVDPAYAAAGEQAHDAHAEDAAEQLARQASIVATSMALTGGKEEALTGGKEEAPAPVRKPKRPRDDSPLLSIRTPASIEKRASGYSRSLKKCYALREDMNADGMFAFRFRIQPDGSVDSVQVKHASPDTPEIRTCVEKTVAGWKFASSAVGSGINYHERTVRFKFGQ
ncbi:MAG: protein kinase [bacterium]